MSSGGTYLAAAYVVVLFILLVYVGIMTAKLARFTRQIAELAAQEDHEGNLERSAA
jgi:hypothetical protein